jgi:multimeric flavodoxin WrbA
MDMYVLVGSARPRGFSAQAAAIINEKAAGRADVTLDRAFALKVGYCLGCDKCKGTRVCVRGDDMAGVVARLDAADKVVICSSVQFSGAPAQLKAIIDRTQLYYNNPVTEGRKLEYNFILFGGARSYKEQFEGVINEFKHVIRFTNGVTGQILTYSATDAFGDKLPGHVVSDVEAFAERLLS